MKPRREIASFTLVEMLVGVAVFSLLVLLLFSILNNATGLWRQQSSKEEDFREARAGLKAITRDFSVALMTTNTAWFSLTTTTTNSQIAFLATLPDDAQGQGLNNGDICAVGYSWEYGTNDAGEAQPNMSLYRYVSFSGPTYTNIVLGGGAVSSVFVNPDYVNTVRELVARNVTQFAVTTYTNDPTTGIPSVIATPTVLPNLINITVSTVNDRTAALLTTQAQWLTPNTPLIQRNQETFNLRIRPQGP